MYASIFTLADSLRHQFNEIPSDRKDMLTKISTYIQGKKNLSQTARLVFICTHNSRRSHFGQVAAAVASNFYGIPNIEVYSGGTEATAFHPNAIQALKSFGFLVETLNPDALNPIWKVGFGENETTTCFSKVFDDPTNPTESFAAIMTCSDAEQNCPFVPGTELGIGTTYEDPKVSDGTLQQMATYSARFEQILREMLFAFSLIKQFD